MPAMDESELEAFLDAAFPESELTVRVEEVRDDGVRLRQPFASRNLRPGGTISGPTLMTLADTAAWVAVLSRIGPVALAVTTSLHIDFLRRPSPADVVADARLLKLGRRLAVAEVDLRAGGPELVARAAVTYSIPPGR